MRPQAIPWLHGEIHEGWQIAQADSNTFPKTTTTVNLQKYKDIYHTSQINVYLILYIYIYTYVQISQGFLDQILMWSVVTTRFNLIFGRCLWIWL